MHGCGHVQTIDKLNSTPLSSLLASNSLRQNYEELHN